MTRRPLRTALLLGAALAASAPWVADLPRSLSVTLWVLAGWLALVAFGGA